MIALARPRGNNGNACFESGILLTFTGEILFSLRRGDVIVTFHNAVTLSRYLLSSGKSTSLTVISHDQSCQGVKIEGDKEPIIVRS